LPLPSRQLIQLSNVTWIENIAVRKTGELLLTFLTPNASVYQIPKPNSPKPRVSLVHAFSSVTSLAGITETDEDVFMVAGQTISSIGANGTAAIFSLDFRDPMPREKPVAALPEVLLANGMTVLPYGRTTVLLADSFGGCVYRIDTETGRYDKAIQIPEMAPGASVGINGLHVHAGYLYFTNSNLVTIFRVKVTPNGAVSPGALVETVAKLDGVFLDDFAMQADGTIYVATNRDNRIIALKPDEKGGYRSGVTVAGSVNSSTVAGDTAVAFGRTKRDENVLYVVTSNPRNGTTVSGGKVAAVDTAGY
jgi:hypothetical protein